MCIPEPLRQGHLVIQYVHHRKVLMYSMFLVSKPLTVVECDCVHWGMREQRSFNTLCCIKSEIIRNLFWHLLGLIFWDQLLSNCSLFTYRVMYNVTYAPPLDQQSPKDIASNASKVEWRKSVVTNRSIRHMQNMLWLCEHYTCRSSILDFTIRLL